MSTHTNDVCGYITPNYTTMIHVVGIYYGTIALSRGLTRITVNDSKIEGISPHDSRNNIRNNGTRLSGTTNCDAFHV